MYENIAARNVFCRRYALDRKANTMAAYGTSFHAINTQFQCYFGNGKRHGPLQPMRVMEEIT